MRRVLALCLCLFVLLSGGCRKKEEPPAPETVSAAIGKGFDAKATIQMGELAADVDINRTAEGICTVQMTAPKSLNGLSFAFAEETVTVSYLGLSFELNQDAVFSSAMTKAVVAAINQAAEPNGVKLAVDDEGVTVSGTTESGDFTLLLSRSDYSMLSLCIPNLDLECHFSPFSYQE